MTYVAPRQLAAPAAERSFRQSAFNADALMAHADYLVGVREFIVDVVSTLAQDVSLMVILPDGVSADALWGLLSDALFKREMHACAVAVNELPTDEPKPMALYDALSLGGNAGGEAPPRSIGGLREQPGLPEVIYLTGLDLLKPGVVQEWLDLARNWAWAAKQASVQHGGGNGSGMNSIGALCLAVPASALPALPCSDVERLKVRSWWGIPSALEMGVLCRLLEPEPSAATRWREHLLPSLCGADIALAARLWDAVVSPDVAFLCGELIAAAQEREWTRASLESWGLRPFLTIPPCPPGGAPFTFGASAHPLEAAFTLWARGVIAWTPEWGMEASVAALALLDAGENGVDLNKSDLLRHRLWRGQAAACLPLVDAVRGAACAHLLRRERRERLIANNRFLLILDERDRQAALESPWRCELGYLDQLTRSAPEAQFDDAFCAAIGAAKRIRNTIAHYQIVSFSEYEDLLERLHALEPADADANDTSY